jgi:extracellular factor (EF) 3-hydroxypalmitic acid methyl ester biosynthesis protein
MSPVVTSYKPNHGQGAEGTANPTTKPRPASALPLAETQVIFQSADGLTVRGTPLHLNRHTVVLELYNASLAPRLTETLENFRIIFQERTLYSGRAVVSNLVEAGATTVCDASLDEANWTGLDFTQPPADGQVVQEFKNFLGEWQKLYQIGAEFKVIVGDMQTFLTDLRLWLEQVELGIRAASAVERPALEQKIAGELGPQILPLLTNLFEKFENCLRVIEPDRLPAHQAFARRQLHPLLLCSPFLYRCFTKPLGYAGDYEMVNMMLRDPLEGASLYAKLINLWFVQQPPAEAHRNRIKSLVRYLEAATLRAMSQGRSARILNIGCGPVHEVQRFLQESSLADNVEFTLLDFSEETLTHCRAIVTTSQSKYARRTQFNFVKKSVQQIVKEASRGTSSELTGDYDLVYCAGLYDYLSDSVCRRLNGIFYDWLRPGGTLVITNVDIYNPRRITMDHIMEWHLFYRRATDLMALKPESAPEDWCGVKSDPTGVNIYFEAQKPERE